MPRSVPLSIALLLVTIGALALGLGMPARFPVERLERETDALLTVADSARYQASHERLLAIAEFQRASQLAARLRSLVLDPVESSGEEGEWVEFLRWIETRQGAPTIEGGGWAAIAREAVSGKGDSEPGSDPRSRLAGAVRSLRHGEAQEAARRAAELLQDAPGFVGARWVLALARAQLGESPYETLQEALAWAPKSPVLGRAVVRWRTAQAAFQCAVGAFEQNPEEALKAFDEFLSNGGAETVDVLLRMASCHERTSSSERAYDLYRRVLGLKIELSRKLPAAKGMGRIEFQAGRYKLATIALGVVVANDKEDGESCAMLARALARDDPPQFKRAADWMEEAVRRGHDGRDMQLELGRVLFSAQEWEKAERAFRRSLEISETADASTGLANSLIRSGGFEEARRLLKRALELDPSSAEARFLLGMVDYFTSDDPAAAAREIDRAVESGFRTPAALLMRAKCRSDAENLDEALEDLRAVLREDPQSIEGLNLRAQIYLKTRKVEEALADAEMALRLGGSSIDLHLTRAAAKMILREPSDALDSLNHAAEIAPERHDLHAKRFLVFLELGEIEGALKAIDRAVELAPLNSSYRLHRGWVRLRLRQAAGALADFEAVRKESPGNLTAVEWVGRAHVELGRVEEGLAELQVVLEAQGPSRTDLWLIVARIELDRGRVEEALVAAERAERGTAEELEGLLISGRALSALKRAEAAMSKFDQALDRYPEAAPAWFRRGEAKAGLGISGAETDLKKAMELDPALKGAADLLLEKLKPKGPSR
ncbi:MAG TPA: tetratricopeptide repeat protein [Planctomycetota bacterium]|nr:tetratricopeptide repeat protein [Planctomycetota bacterium]